MLINSDMNYNNSPFLLSPAISYFDLYTVLSNKCAQDFSVLGFLTAMCQGGGGGGKHEMNA